MPNRVTRRAKSFSQAKIAVARGFESRISKAFSNNGPARPNVCELYRFCFIDSGGVLPNSVSAEDPESVLFYTRSMALALVIAELPCSLIWAVTFLIGVARASLDRIGNFGIADLILFPR